MAIVKRFNLKGLATKIDDLYKKQEMATDCLNVTKNYSGRIEGRKGVLKIADVSCSDMYYSREKQKHYKFTNVIQDSSGGVTFDSLAPMFTHSGNPIVNTKKSITEIDGYIYFSDTTQADPVMMTDGKSYYQSGIPELKITSQVGFAPSTDGFGVGYTAGSTATYVKMALCKIGSNGETTFGPVGETVLQTNGGSLAYSCALIKYLNSANGTKYNEKFISTSATITSITGGAITSSTAFTTNYVSGDYIGLVAADGSVSQVKITSIDIPNKKIYIDSLATFAGVMRNFLVFAFTSFDGLKYSFVGSFPLAGNAVSDDNTLSIGFAPVGIYGTDVPTIDDFLDVTDGRYEPIKCKYIASFSGKLVSLNLKDSFTDAISQSEALPYSICFSSNGEGSSADTFNYSNIITVGSPDEGQIIGAGQCGGNLVILKESATYIVVVNQYGDIGRIVKASATVGCASNKAILNFDNSLAWLSDKGVFSLSKTGEPEELTEEIENIFTDNPYSLDFSNSRVAIDRFNETILFYCPHTTTRSSDVSLVFSYKWKEWYLWKGLNALNGFYHTGDTFFFNDGTKSYKINKSSMNDNISGSDVAVERYYSSGWEHLGEPANEKKFNNLVVFSVQNPEYSYESWNCQVKSDYDWNTSNEVPIDSEKTFSTSTRRNFVNCDKTACYSRRFTFYNNTIDQGFSLSGYEFEVIQTQQRMRD